MSYFASLLVAPPDPVFGLVSAFREDKRSEKISLIVGYYCDEKGKTPFFKSIKDAEKELALPTEYLPMTGDESYLSTMAELVFGPHFSKVKKNLQAAQAIGGTGALRILGDLLYLLGRRSIWVSDPTWPNHIGIFSTAQLAVQPYPYYDPAAHGVSFQEMCALFARIPEKSPILLHVVCHNPTGFDLSQEQWEELADLFKRRELFPIFDFAYQGFGKGVQEDAAPLHLFIEKGLELAVTYSCSKSFGLYAERVGALFVVEQQKSEGLSTQIQRICRTTHSNPPRYGAALVQRVLKTPELYQQWEAELAAMRLRMQEIKALLVEGLKRKDPEGDWDFLLKSNGLFAYTGLGKQACEKMVTQYGIYLPSNGRVNITAINKGNVEYIADAIASCKKGS